MKLLSSKDTNFEVILNEVFKPHLSQKKTQIIQNSLLSCLNSYANRKCTQRLSCGWILALYPITRSTI